MDKASTAAVWARFGDRLRGFISKRVRNESDVQDVLQEIFAKIHLRMGGLKDSEKLEPWLFQVARRAVADYFRKRPGGQALGLPKGMAIAPAPRDVSAEVASWLDPMLELLSRDDRDALRMADLGGLSQKALAKKLGISLTGAKSRIQRARRRLKEALLDCCHFELDRRGNAIGYTRKRTGCGPCSCGQI